MAIFLHLKHVQISNQYKKVNTKSTNLDSTYNIRSVFQHLPSGAQQERLLLLQRELRNKLNISIFFLYQKSKNCKSFFFPSERLISVEFKFRKKIFTRNFLFYLLKEFFFFRIQIVLFAQKNLFNFFANRCRLPKTTSSQG